MVIKGVDIFLAVIKIEFGGKIYQDKGGSMKRNLVAMIVMASLLTACVVVPPRDRRSPGHGPGRAVIAPLLPTIVVLEAEPYYFYSDFYYHYDNNRWYYSKSKRGPWADLPRNRYPQEVRFKGRDGKHDRDDREHDDRGRENQRR